MFKKILLVSLLLVSANATVDYFNKKNIKSIEQCYLNAKAKENTDNDISNNLEYLCINGLTYVSYKGSISQMFIRGYYNHSVHVAKCTCD